MTYRLISTLSLIALASVPAPALAKRASLPDQAELGRDSKGDPCTAVRYWDDPAANDPFSDSFSMTCRGATASRHLGVVRRVGNSDAQSVQSFLLCGTASTFTVPQIGEVRARRCFDKLLNLETIETSVSRNGRLITVSAVATAQGPAEEALRMLAGVRINFSERGRTVAPAVADATLAPSPQGVAGSATSSDVDVTLQQGHRLVRQGLYMEASRVLNDGLSRLPADAQVATRVELLLVAGLSDSNLKFFDSAENYFNRADQLLAANPGTPDAESLLRKRRSYAALDLLNRRAFNQALEKLDKLTLRQTEEGQPLLDSALIMTLNQPKVSSSNHAEVVASRDTKPLSQLVIDAQAQWARSIALLAQNRPKQSEAALALADRSFSVLRQEKVDQQQVRWLDSRIERQRARLLLRMGDRAGALAALDKAIASLRRAEAAGAVGPTLAEAQLERAGLLARGGGSADALLVNFETAVDSLIAADAQGTVLPPSIEQYLDLLVADAKVNPAGKSPERFFRALQAVGDPAIARQFIQLQSVVTADPSLAAKVQDQQDLEREITRIRFEIASAPENDSKTLEVLNTRRAQLESQLLALENELQGSKAYGAVNDSPVTIDELRRNLQPGEVFFKLTKVRNYAFGMVIDAQGAQIYRVQLPMVEVEPLAKRVRESIDGGGSKLPLFDVRGANALFQLLIGPVADRIIAAKSLIVDTSGPLQSLPIGVLVTDRESVANYAATRVRAPYDYTMVNFLAKQVPISTALSPRSLLVSRSLQPSTAPLPFIGFAQHLPVTITSQFDGQMISVGSGCEVEASAIAALTRQLRPIDERELDRAGRALGLTNSPRMTGADFTDGAVMQRTDLDQFQVLHFATHGLTEGQWGCAKSPPALVTSLGGGGSDAILSFGEIAKLRLDANLVVLSACDTAAGVSAGEARAAGQEEAGATLEGLVRAFLAANARAVLSTYWPISDAGESEALIEDFYAAARNGTIGEALRTAQSELMVNPKSSHPFYWGAFFVVGDAQKPLLTGGARAALGEPAAVARLAAGLSQ